MSTLQQWRPALRMARRDLRRHRLRALLTCVLVALPVVVATVAALGSYNTRWDPEQEARAAMGAADAQLQISPFAAVRPKDALWFSARPAEFTQSPRRPVRRDPGEIDPAALLPQGASLVPMPGSDRVELSTGGSLSVAFLDLESPVTVPFAEITAGRAPEAADELAVPEAVADELGFLEDGAPRADAEVLLADGTALQVVGIARTSGPWDEGSPTLVAPLDSVLASGRDDRRFLVDLPDLSPAEVEELVRELSAVGVVLQPRGAVLDPAAWGLEDFGDPIETEPLVVGTFVILVGMLEVVLIVGAAFSVAARRQVRDLGLMAANGGVSADVRRVLLAQGLVLGVGSSLVGVLLGMLAFRGLARSWEQLFGQVLWRQELDWLALVVIAVLGSLTSLVAALLPAWSISRLTPVAALSGRFPLRLGEARAHRGAFVLLCSGLVLLAIGGWLTARTFGPGGQEETLAPAVAGLGLVMVVAGAVWATPYVVRRAAELGRVLPMSGRYAFRDAGRHRFRSAASVMALMITVAGAVLVGFASSSAAATTTWGPAPRTMEVFVGSGPQRGTSPERLALMEATVENVMGPVDTLSSYGVGLEGQPRSHVRVRGLDGELQVTDEGSLAAFTGADDAVLEAFEGGAMVVLGLGRATFAESARIRVQPGKGGDPESWTLRAVVSTASAPNGYVTTAFISEETAKRFGLEPTYGQTYFTAERPFTEDDLDRLAVYGIDGYSTDPDRAMAARAQLAGLAVAGALCALVVGVAVALAAAESRDEVATLAAVGAGPWHRRRFGAMHGLFLGLVGAALGVTVGVPAGLALSQVDGLAGANLPWLTTAGTVLVVLVTAPLAGWVVTPSRLRLDRRTA